MSKTTATATGDGDILVTRVELAELLGVSSNRVAQLEEEGWLDPVNSQPGTGRGKAKRYDLGEFLRFLQARGGYCPTCRRGSKRAEFGGL